ncbi:hypothetical protein UlMin_008186 [Ulmus minor]
MDYQQQPCRPRPPIQGNICPTCSFSHFPFCPPPPPFFHNPGFPIGPDHSFHRPGFDPYSRQPMGIPNGGLGNPRPFDGNPSFDRGPYGQFAYSEGFAPPYGGNGFVGEGDRNNKRPRIDSYEEFNPNSARVFSDDERRLKMIRDHGGVSCGATEVGGPYLQEKRNGFHSHGDGFVHPNPVENSANSPYSYTHNWQSSRFTRPPLPLSPPPPLPVDPPLHYSSQPRMPSSLFPVPASSSAMNSPSCPPIPEPQALAQPYFHSNSFLHTSSGFPIPESQGIHGTLSKHYTGEEHPFPLKQPSPEKPQVVDASHLFKQPHRATRPDHFVIILRGLPGSGKSYLAKKLRDIEVENGGAAPRIHSMDDYFMTEVEKVEKGDGLKSLGSVRGKKPVTMKVMEYCYEPEMEEAYRSSMLKAFKKTLEEGAFTLIIVDDRNLRVADFAQFWAIAKSSGYEVYVSEASYKDPAGCAARNVHGFTLNDIQNMACQWEEAPSFHLRLDVKSLFDGDDLKKGGIQEVDMAMEDEADGRCLTVLQERNHDKTIVPPVADDTADDSPQDEKSWNADEENTTEVKELGRSKWSNELDEDDTEKTEQVKGNLNALSGLIQAYGKEAKSVRWGDQGGSSGFSIGRVKNFSLVIGPGAGYNLKSNPLPEEGGSNSGKVKRPSIFEEQLRAERESFKAVFNRKQQRIGLDLDEE